MMPATNIRDALEGLLGLLPTTLHLEERRALSMVRGWLRDTADGADLPFTLDDLRGYAIVRRSVRNGSATLPEWWNAFQSVKGTINRLAEGSFMPATFLDQCDADAAALAFVESFRDHVSPMEIRKNSLAIEGREIDGRVLTVWKPKLVGAALIIRDDFNRSVLVRIRVQA